MCALKDLKFDKNIFKINPSTGVSKADEKVIKEMVKNGSDLQDIADTYDINIDVVKLLSKDGTLPKNNNQSIF